MIENILWGMFALSLLGFLIALLRAIHIEEQKRIAEILKNCDDKRINEIFQDGLSTYRKEFLTNVKQ